MRYIIGIDLGTTNSCVCFVDTQDPKLSVQLFRIPQVHRFGHVEALPSLPSFCFFGSPQPLPWNKAPAYDVGAFARDEGSKTPTKLVESAKSWLCHSAANRRDRLLPVEAANEADRVSPVEASARYLRHLKDAWNHSKAKGSLDAIFEEQDIVLTVPASFDEAARTLTIEAARSAGIRQLTLLEEPQAAFYSWLAQHEQRWKEFLKAGDSILVCDVGGGTTDFSLIDVYESGGELSLQRMSVGDHLLLGGDNMDIAIARTIEPRLFGTGKHELPVTQWLQLRHQARKAKEALLDENAREGAYRFLLQGAGSSVVAQTLSAEISAAEVRKLLVDGFFPVLDWDVARELRRGSGVRTMGLPYETEPAVTKHLAAFLQTNGERPKSAPDYVLFNGGAMKPPAFQEAIISSLKRWFPGSQPQVLPSYNLDLAVGRGAAYYGRVRRGFGVRIGGGSARGYYLGIDVQDADGARSAKALTLLPRGSEEGASYEPERLFLLRPNLPVSFTLYSSHVRLHDKSGDLIDIDPKEMHVLPPIQTILRFGKSGAEQAVPVRVGIALSAIGTINLWLQAEKSGNKWELEFQLRNTDGKEETGGDARRDETFDASYLTKSREAVALAFSGEGKMSRLMETLEELLERPRREWPPSVLRGLWETVWKLASQRKMSGENEVRWWNLAGFMLRPGFGYPLDDFRLKELWKIILSDQKAARTPDLDIQRWICLRRVAAGLSRGQQGQIAAELWPLLLDKQTGKIAVKGKGEAYQYTERLRTAASLELVEQPLKVKLGNAILARIGKEEALPVELWALGRLGTRHLFHGAAANVVSRDVAAGWIEKLLASGTKSEEWSFAVGQIARKTDQRELNLPAALLQKVLAECSGNDSCQRLKTLLTDAGPLTQNEQNRVFGEQLPAGLVLQL